MIGCSDNHLLSGWSSRKTGCLKKSSSSLSLYVEMNDAAIITEKQTDRRSSLLSDWLWLLVIKCNQNYHFNLAFTIIVGKMIIGLVFECKVCFVHCSEIYDMTKVCLICVWQKISYHYDFAICQVLKYYIRWRLFYLILRYLRWFY